MDKFNDWLLPSEKTTIKSKEMWTAFFQHPCWKEFTDTCKVRLSMTRDELEVGVKEQFEENRGEARSLRFVLAFEELVLSEPEPRQKENEDDLEPNEE
jgi:hypothetical protein